MRYRYWNFCLLSHHNYILERLQMLRWSEWFELSNQQCFLFGLWHQWPTICLWIAGQTLNIYIYIISSSLFDRRWEIISWRPELETMSKLLNSTDIIIYFMTLLTLLLQRHDDVIKWKPFPRYWPFVRGIHRSPSRSFVVFLDLNKRLSKQSWGWWFEPPSHPLWRQCYDTQWNN